MNSHQFIMKYQIVKVNLIAVFLGLVQAFEECPNIESYPKYEFYPLRHCQRSNGTVIAFKNVKNLEECANLARDRYGLAFNFKPNDRRDKNLYDIIKNKSEVVLNKNINDASQESYNCQVLECPEYGNFSGMLNDTRYDYYSLYTKPIRKLL